MTYHPVTTEELEQIKYDCIMGKSHSCIKCEHGIIRVGNGCECSFDKNKIIGKILTRPDPLALLEKWINWNKKYMNYQMDIRIYEHFIKQLRENPEAVVEMGEKERWLE